MMWAEQGFEQAAAALLNLPRAGADPTACAHAVILPLRTDFDPSRRAWVRYERCVACLRSWRRPITRFGVREDPS